MRTHLTRRLIAASSAVVVTLGGAATFAATTATAAPSGSTGAGAGVSLLSTVDAAGQQAALDYWTPERLAQAVPVDRVVTGRGAGAPGAAAALGTPAPSTATVQPRATSTTTGDAPVLPRGPRSAAGVVTGDAVSTARNWAGPAVPTVGRLYFTQGTGQFECTASSVDSPKGNVIATAGHCVTEGGLDSKNLVFVPGLAGTSEPQGEFAVGQTFTTTQWRTGDQQSAAALNYDVGFALVSPKAGKSLKDTVGAYSIAFDTPLSRVTVLGYPGRSRTADGYTLQYCTGAEFTDNGDGATTDVATLCDLGGGSSGGPWLRDFDPAKGTGTLTSVVSFSYDDNASVLYGPRFGSVVRDVYTRAANA